MYKIEIYADKEGVEPLTEYVLELLQRNDKDSRIKARKILQYISFLEQSGTFIGQPIVKHIEGDLWELRPAKDRVLFMVMKQGKFLLLHVFTKKTKKTPEREIEKALAEYRDYIERGLDKDE
ncbi:MAG: type II toxin-antitoxin system RelE/ParE family toxin [Selenomonadaceae bacterium]|nr:type II toxin-antitoxin system RelE/ParE family toxin [Selenomonadaceae bacterium]MBR3723545.1 type II toxin-antitoxin system RelE/ParE family toxin [Selenomonadaceae bacterium]